MDHSSLENTWDVSVIICAYTENRWADLVEAVKSLQHQSQKPYEIILSIDHNPPLYQRAREYFPLEIQVIQNSEPKGLSGARNRGIAVSKGNIIAFFDDDAIAEFSWLEKLCKPYQDSRVLGTGGVIIPLWNSPKPGWFPEEFNWVVGCTYRGFVETPAPVRNLIGCNMSFRNALFEHVGMFRSGVGRIGALPYGCEETELCIRANQQFPDGRFMHEPSARVLHHVPDGRATFRYFCSRCYAEGISKAQVTQLVGGRDGLSSERTYTTRTLPKGIVQGFRDAILKGDRHGFGRAWAILVGLGFTTLGYLVGKLLLLILHEKTMEFSLRRQTSYDTFRK
jgi:glucosyl-dolichyl phosphate glucuronosyltransferase